MCAVALAEESKDRRLRLPIIRGPATILLQFPVQAVLRDQRGSHAHVALFALTLRDVMPRMLFIRERLLKHRVRILPTEHLEGKAIRRDPIEIH
ncbi:MAG: hypothetical protein ACK55I_50055, partial [bacterium]